MSWEYRNELLLYQMAAIPALVAVQAAVVYTVLLVIRLIDFACASAAALEERKPAPTGMQAEGVCVCDGGTQAVVARSGRRMIEVAVAPEEPTVEVEQQADPTRAPIVVQDARGSVSPSAAVRRVEEERRDDTTVACEVEFDAARRPPSNATSDTTGRAVTTLRG